MAAIHSAAEASEGMRDRREAREHTAHFGAVGQAGAFELLGKETAEKHPEPFEDKGGGIEVGALKCLAGQGCRSFRARSRSGGCGRGRSHGGCRALRCLRSSGYLSVGITGAAARTHGVSTISASVAATLCGRRRWRLLLQTTPRDSARGFRDSGIDSIHRHMVAIVGGPSECELRRGRLCRALCPPSGWQHPSISVSRLARLRVFICYVVDSRVVGNVGEVLPTAGPIGISRMVTPSPFMRAMALS